MLKEQDLHVVIPWDSPQNPQLGPPSPAQEWVALGREKCEWKPQPDSFLPVTTELGMTK